MSLKNNAKTTPNPWAVLALICVPVFIGSLDLTIVSAFLPEIILKLELPLQTSLDEASWVVSGYLLAYAISMTFMGRISDLIGRRRVYIACLLVFIVGSIMVATAHLWPTEILYTLFRRLGQRPDEASVTLLAIIIGRIVQALGAGALVPVSLALVGDIFPPERRAQPLGVIGAVDTMGWVLGHLYGGVLVNFFATHATTFTDFFKQVGLNWPAPDWRTLFWINVPVTLVALALTLWALRKVPMRLAKGRFDFLGTVFIVGSLISLILALGGNTEISTTAASFDDLKKSPDYALPLLLLAAILFLGFIFIESRIKDPLIDLRMFRRRNVSSGSIINLFIGFCLMIGLVSVPILINVRVADSTKLSEAALQVGILLSALTVPMALAAVPGGWLSDRIGYQKTTILGLVLAIIGFVLIWRTWTIDLPNGIIVLEMILIGVGIGLTFSPISAAVINSADDSHRGVASALVIILRLLGMTVAVASLTTWALQRVSMLAAAVLGPGSSDPRQFIDVYARITVQVLGDLGFIGAAVCLVALIPAVIGLRPASPANPQPMPDETPAPITGD
jgi:MFS family permease